MTEITFSKTVEDEARILADGEHVGDLYRHTDPLDGGAVYIAHLDEDPRGFRRIRDRARVRQVVASMVDSHPLW